MHCKRDLQMRYNFVIDSMSLHCMFKVIDETLRLANLSFTLFREAKTDVHMNG